MTMNRKRKNQIALWLSDEERQMLDEIANRTGLSRSDVIRQMIRREHEQDESKTAA
jgi:uncharacterized protein (DUF1778 family)